MEQITAKDFWGIVARRYEAKPDTLRISMGHHELLSPNEPLGFFNLPQFLAIVSVDLGQIRTWAALDGSLDKPNVF